MTFALGHLLYFTLFQKKEPEGHVELTEHSSPFRRCVGQRRLDLVTGVHV
jgi:hypothetical protein